MNLEQFLHERGEQLIRSGREWRMASDHSVTIRGNEWYDHANGEGGGPISFVRRLYGVDYVGAMQMLLDERIEYVPMHRSEPHSPKPFELPPRNSDMRRVFAYLCKERRISQSVVAHFVHEGTLYEDAKYHNCVFVGKDENGIPRHAHKRSTNGNGKALRLNAEGCDPRYSFHHIGTSDVLFVFEAPIDMLSYITLNPTDWKRHSYMACCGTSSRPVEWMIEHLPNVGRVFLCLDGDHAGRMATDRMSKLLTDMVKEVDVLVPHRKDWNEDLVQITLQKEVHEPRMSFQY